MIPKDCKRLAEVDFPVAVVSEHAAREKSIRHGHPSTLHLWWARRPLASCRAMLLAVLLPDPADQNCPQQFRDNARSALAKFGPAFQSQKADNQNLREALMNFIGTFANWDLASSPEHLNAARRLVRAAHGEKPLVADPFAGGGSIPLEALRIGCNAFASDLNPVACLILRAMLEEIPKRGPQIADELRNLGKQVKNKAEKKLAKLYPKDPDGAVPVAYIWARTVQCESPQCGAEIPLMRSFWLAKKPGRKIALRPRTPKNEKPPRVDFEIFHPKSEEEVHPGTIERAKATCLCCQSILPAERVRAQLAAQRGGADVVFGKNGKRVGGARMLAVVNSVPGKNGRFYRLPSDSDYAAVQLAEKRISKIISEWEKGGKVGPCPVPDEPLPKERQKGNSGIRIIPYGMSTFGDLFSLRQKLALLELMEATRDCSADARTLMALMFSRMVDGGSSFCRWHNTGEKHTGIFGRQAIGMVWDFSEVNPLSLKTGGYSGAVNWVSKVAANIPRSDAGIVQQSDAQEHPLSNSAVDALFTDPPYYDAIAYADLSDFFLVWLKRALSGHFASPDPFDMNNPLSPKLREAIQDQNREVGDGKVKDAKFYEEAMRKVFVEGRRILQGEGIASVVFAHKTTEGWETLISGMIYGGWTITASWPITTEMGERVNARDTAHLATSVHLVCRPRPADAGVGEWADVLRELPKRVGDWVERLQDEGIRGADLIFSCIGPALEVFSCYSEVRKPDDSVVGLPEYLSRVWEEVARAALEQILGTEEAKARNGAAGAVEEDARLTALFLWTMRSTKGLSGNGVNGEGEDAKSFRMSLPFDVVRRFSQPLGINLEEWEGRIIKTEGGVVSLIPVSLRSRQLLGENAKAAAGELERGSDLGRKLFSEGGSRFRRRRRSAVLLDEGGRTLTGGDGAALSGGVGARPQTTLDRVHTAMLLHKGSQSAALRALVEREKERGPHFLRLVNSLSALYPRGGEELRWAEGVAMVAK